ncbi:Asp23/Gls24 family envelope stress response protein [Ligilactobacillus saerimneri]|uniref:Alkaline shock protein n=2 Tax=Ligilactobacillus saerimneri TaxID=228229 RepID=M5J7D1_9LACO|nr:Asp23/Gls24 family envelope stress response protein [Ligilactobacillus saerimneri]EKW98634.1 alkaline shock protein [Ligilactobacillus saerimneri 30a]KRL74981.1 alkaline shock protein [Ligilactobacillus saerimneri DSM 16049]MBU5309014.1 Asp23/Gls24 family envelope stress response protein [Ligilactobacillus saerimneri]MCZ0891643.1 Asp23/Gls24 family envelope stress response protein [Ligilactobacillus saerimneri]MDI9205657.1 Asp23/Gls24 family envelope stress response protein [Ligilactobacill
MAEDNSILLANKEPNLGQIRIAPEVIEIIIGIAASQVEGVYSMQGSFANNVSEFFGRKSHSKGVHLENSADGIIVDLYAFLDYGVSVPKVAVAIQDKVVQQVLFMTGLKLQTVNVHIEGVISQKEEQVVDPDNIFAEDNGDEQ